MNGSVVRRVCCVVGTDVVITVGVGLVHWSDILTTVTARPATSAAPTTPATDTAVVLRYHAPRSSGSGVGGGATGADTSERPAGGKSGRTLRRQ
ncbi:hypothetical protein GCM10009701_32650 [Mycolicibacterium murale]|uniref:Uncharacterized protein n=1 Tax=Mycolicibacterium tokaiense TaxID=39695 RepID=A0A378TID2_9MYCO|nr:hypothetical protein MTOK_08730 [Mycolicibacterium tokaiense]STZ60400.1 Uncharacterised protein [Mycolicibacterium tokaiense]